MQPAVHAPYAPVCDPCCTPSRLTVALPCPMPSPNLQSGGMPGISLARQAGGPNPNVSALVFARWVSLCYISLAQLRVVFPGGLAGLLQPHRCVSRSATPPWRSCGCVPRRAG